MPRINKAINQFFLSDSRSGSTIAMELWRKEKKKMFVESENCVRRMNNTENIILTRHRNRKYKQWRRAFSHEDVAHSDYSTLTCFSRSNPSRLVATSQFSNQLIFKEKKTQFFLWKQFSPRIFLSLLLLFLWVFSVWRREIRHLCFSVFPFVRAVVVFVCWCLVSL